LREKLKLAYKELELMNLDDEYLQDEVILKKMEEEEEGEDEIIEVTEDSLDAVKKELIV
jgi:hypothetical protein